MSLEVEGGGATSDPVADSPLAGRRKLRHVIADHPSMIAAGLMLLAIVVAVVLAPLIAHARPDQIVVTDRLKGPSGAHLFGTDNLGRDILARTLYGGRTSLEIGLVVALISVGGGTLIGLLVGFYEIVDMIVMRIVDGLMALPALVLAISMIGVLGAGTTTVVICLSIVYIPRVVRVIRGSVLIIRKSTFVDDERALGQSEPYILFRHVLPHCMSPVIVQASFIFSYAILAEAGLSFLGVGIPDSVPSWGNILTDARSYISTAWWMSIFPGLAIALTVLSLNVFGDGLRDMLDPRLKER
ncbi:MAG: peptide transporter permease [Marmoricola sp.]|jgi:peptide/nickel transport system permease protein|nr:peptide transporter permease [Marmoricola sp.]